MTRRLCHGESAARVSDIQLAGRSLPSSLPPSFPPSLPPSLPASLASSVGCLPDWMAQKSGFNSFSLGCAAILVAFGAGKRPAPTLQSQKQRLFLSFFLSLSLSVRLSVRLSVSLFLLRKCKTEIPMEESLVHP